MGARVEGQERREIADLLRYGFSVTQTCRMSGRSETAVTRIRDDEGIRPHAMGCPQKIVQPPDLDDEGDLEAGAPHVDAVVVHRPNQHQWLTVIARAEDDPEEQRRLWRDIRRALGLTRHITEEGVAMAAIQDPRPADELARLYLLARRSRRYG